MDVIALLKNRIVPSVCRLYRQWGWFFLVLLLTGYSSSSSASVVCREANGQPRDCSVLLVHSYHPSLEWAQVLSEHFSAALTSASQVRIDTEFLDAKRRPSLEHADTFITLLREKYGPRPPDVLVISDDPAFDLIWPIHEKLLPGVPVVFMGLNTVRSELTDTPPGITGVYEQHTTEQTVRLALELTNADGIIVINDTSETGKANEVKLAEVINANPDIEWVIERDVTVESVSHLSTLPADWPLITMLPLREDGENGPMLSHRRSVELLREQLPNPLFYGSEWVMGTGLVGGYCLSGTDHSRRAGELVLEILKGTSPEQLAIEYEAKHQWIFDQRELDRFGWSLDQLPKNAVIMFAETSFLEKHRAAIYPLLMALAVAVFTIVLLGVTINRQRKAKAKLRIQEQRLSAALSASDAGVFEIKPSGTYASPRWLELTDVASSKTVNENEVRWLTHANFESQAAFKKAMDSLTTGSPRERVEITIDDVRPRVIDVLMTSSREEPNREGTIVGVATDVTVNRQLQEEAARRNRLEILGELAGGIAHDFNNFLLVVKFCTEMAKETTNADELQKLVLEIEEAGASATKVVKQLLAFGRDDSTPKNRLQVREAIREVQPFLERLVGIGAELSVVLKDNNLTLPIDLHQLERVLSNLVVNARDAMANGGNIEVEIRAEFVDNKDCVVIYVRDQGEGMDDATRTRIFEPFFSTKPVNEGTGLGLSTVYGIVKNSGGTIAVDTAQGVGTTFKLVWPRDALAAPVAARSVTPWRGLANKSILLVEDDPFVGPVTQKMLEKAGSCAVLAKNGSEGLSIFSKRPEDFDLVLSDVVMPEMNGIDMVSEMRRLKPSVSVGFMSGYTDHPSLGGKKLPAEAELLGKPFSMEDLQAFVERLFEDLEKKLGKDHSYV